MRLGYICIINTCNKDLEPGARGRFVGYLTAIIPAVFSMGGTEVIAM